MERRLAIGRWFVAAAALCAGAGCSTPRRSAVNTVHVEAFGSAASYSVNYERMRNRDLALRAGGSYLVATFIDKTPAATPQVDLKAAALPLTASYLGVGNGNHSLELGGGVVPAWLEVRGGTARYNQFVASTGGFRLFGTFLLGYRYQPIDGGIQFRIGLDWLVGKELSDAPPGTLGVAVGPHLSGGYTF